VWSKEKSGETANLKYNKKSAKTKRPLVRRGGGSSDPAEGVRNPVASAGMAVGRRRWPTWSPYGVGVWL